MKTKNTAKTRRDALANPFRSKVEVNPAVQAPESPIPVPEHIPAVKAKPMVHVYIPEPEEKEDTLSFTDMLDRYMKLPTVPAQQTRKKVGLVRTVNLEQGMPTVEEALQRMRLELSTSKSLGYRIVRLIHGYGSSGRGGAIRDAVRKNVTSAIPGEEFDAFHPATRQLLDRYPSLKQDPDFGRCNQGVTLVILSR